MDTKVKSNSRLKKEEEFIHLQNIFETYAESLRTFESFKFENLCKCLKFNNKFQSEQIKKKS